MTMDIHWFGLEEDQRTDLMGICGDDRYRIVEPEVIIPCLPEELNQDSYIRNLDTSLVIKKVAPWPQVSSGTVVIADLHRRDVGGYEIDQQPFALVHFSGASTASADGMFVNEGDWTGRTTHHFTGQTPLDGLRQIATSGMADYYPGTGVVNNPEGNISDLYNTHYRDTLNYVIDVMTPR